MPTKRRARPRGLVIELDAGQIAFLRGEPDPPKGGGLMAWNRWAWLTPPWGYSGGGPGRRCPDGSPDAATLWRQYGGEFIAEREAVGLTTPHPLIAWLGDPMKGESDG